MRRFFTKRRIIIGVIIIIIGGLVSWGIFDGNGANEEVLTDTVKLQNIEQTVLATGQVSSTTDLGLSFKIGGTVQRIQVKVGQQIGEGTVLANLNNRSELASVTQAQGALAQARANYQKVLDGVSSEEVQVAQAAVDATQVTLNSTKKNLDDTRKQQETLVKNAYKNLLNSTFEAIPATSNLGSGIVTISGSYTDDNAGQYQIKVESNGSRFSVSGLESFNKDLIKGVVVPLGTKGLYVQFSNGSYTGTEQWTVEVPNTKAANYVTNLNAYNAALETQKTAMTSAENAVAAAQASLDSAIAQLNAKKAAARPADIAAAQAQITSALGQVEAASAQLENTIIRSPANGTVTTIDIKVGEQATASKIAIVVQDVDSLHVEANVSEANIAQVKTEQEVSFTFDALGPDREFKGVVQQIDPASTVVSGVVNYKVTATVEKVADIKPGMTANMTILTASKGNVLTIPQRAVISKDGKKFVRVVTDPKKKTYEERVVTTGLDADGGVVELLSGLSEGQEIVTFVNAKK